MYASTEALESISSENMPQSYYGPRGLVTPRELGTATPHFKKVADYRGFDSILSDTTQGTPAREALQEYLSDLQILNTPLEESLKISERDVNNINNIDFFNTLLELQFNQHTQDILN